MYHGKRIGVVVPAYNEEDQIGRVVETIPAFVDRIVVVDDCSTDKTPEIVATLASQDRRVVLLRHPENQGVGGAIASGYEWMHDHDLDVAAVMAGDGQMDPSDLPRILEPVISGEVDYAKANRLFSGQAFRKIPKVRYFGNAVLSMLTKIVSGYWHVADSQSGYTAIGKEALRAIDWRHMYKRYGQPNDLLVQLNVNDFRVRDVAVEPVYDVGELSKMRVSRVVLPIAWLLVKLFFWRLKEKYVIRDFHPLVFFYGLGFALFAASAGFFVQLCYLWARQGHAPELTALALLFSLTIALHSTFFAMWFDMESNKHLR